MAVDTLEEFAKKYRHTFVRWIQDNKIWVAYIEGCNLDDSNVHLTIETIGNVILNYPQRLSELILDSPDSGLFNHNDHALYLFKTPARQWQRGLCAANHEVYNPFARLFNQGVYRAQFGRGTVMSIFNPKYRADVAKAVEAVVDHVPKSLAITRNLMISKSVLKDVNNPLVWYKTTPVGHIRDGKFVIEDELYQQEICDELHRIGQEQWISY